MSAAMAQVVEADLGQPDPAEDGLEAAQYTRRLKRFAVLAHEDQIPLVEPDPNGQLLCRLCASVGSQRGRRGLRQHRVRRLVSDLVAVWRG